jgi:histidinol-phosphatase (PHP family)
MLVDYHTHTRLCKHADGVAEDYVRKALELGFDEVGCSDHSPLPNGFDREHRMSLDEFTVFYRPMVDDVQEKFDKKIKVRFGIEADYLPGTEQYVKEFLEENDFDFVIGSVHFLGDWGFDNFRNVLRYEEKDVYEVYVDYFRTLKDAVASGMFDIVGHLDLVKVFGYRPDRNYDDVLLDAMKAIKENGLVVEINTAGLRKPVGEIYPGVEILEIIKEMKIPLTLGSDSHKPGDVGRGFALAVELVKKYGDGKITLFEKRQREEVSV